MSRSFLAAIINGFLKGLSWQPNRSCPDSFLPPNPPPSRRGRHPTILRPASRSTIISDPSMYSFCISLKALSKLPLFSYSTNAYCLDLPVTMSLTSRQLTILPNFVKSNFIVSCKIKKHIRVS